jgi:hypothetical protein
MSLFLLKRPNVKQIVEQLKNSIFLYVNCLKVITPAMTLKTPLKQKSAMGELK